MSHQEALPDTIRGLLVPLSRPVLPQRHLRVQAPELLAAAIVLRTMYADAPKMLDRIARAIPLAEHEVRFGLPEWFGTDEGPSVLKKGFPRLPKGADPYTVLDEDGYAVVIAGYPQASTFCACPDFWNAVHNPTGTCKHQIAAALWVAAQAMADVVPVIADGEQVPSSAGSLLIDPLILFVLLELVTSFQQSMVAVSWTGSGLEVESMGCRRAFATVSGEGAGHVVIHAAEATSLKAALGTDWLTADECLLHFAPGRLSCVAETFTWKSASAANVT